MSGCDVVFHVAADYRLWVRDPEQMYRANVEGTRALLKPRERMACGGWFTRRAWQPWDSLERALGGRKFSGFAGQMIGPYKRSKFMAEQVAYRRRAAKGWMW